MSGIEITKNDLEKKLNDILSRGKSSQAMARVYPLYQSLQTRRFMTEGVSEGKPWPGLKPEYEVRKEKRYARWPGEGRKMLIGTGTLAGAVIGPGAPFEGTEKHRAQFKPWSLQISIATGGTNAEGRPFDYPAYVAERRPFMEFSPQSRQQMKDALSRYLIGDIVSRGVSAA